MEERARGVELKSYLAIIRKRRWVFLSFFLVVLAVTLSRICLISPIYQASVTLMIERPGRVYLVSGGSTVMPQEPSVETQISLVRSRRIAQRAAKILRTKGKDISSEEIVNSIKKTELLPNTDLINIDVQSTDPHKAMLMANGLAEAFVQEKKEMSQTKAKGTKEFIEKQLKVARERLRKAEEALRSFREKEGEFALSEAAASQLKRWDELESSRAQVLADLQALDVRIRRLKQSLREQNKSLYSFEAIRDDKLIQDLKSQLIQKEIELSNAQEKYTEKYPSLIGDLRSQIAQLRKRLNQEISQIVSGSTVILDLQRSLVQDLINSETEKIILQVREQSLSAQIAKYQQQLQALPAKQLQLARLNREATIAEKIYTLLSERYEDARISEVGGGSGTYIVERARLPRTPIKPKPLTDMMLALIIGLAGGFSLAVLTEFLDDTIRTPDDVQKYLKLSVLGFVPKVKEETKRLITNCEPKSLLCEAYRSLHSNISFASIDRPIKTLLVSSPAVGEGKSLTAANLGITMAQWGKKVILVDGDLRRPTLQKIFNLKSDSIGLTDLIIDKYSLDEALQPTGIEGLSILPCGLRPPNPAELLDSQKMQQIIEALKSRADIIVFDSPPSVVVADASVLASKLKDVLLVIDTTTTSRDIALRSKEVIEQAKGQILGVVLNKIDFARGGYYHYYYYSYYYRYYDEDRKRKAG